MPLRNLQRPFAYQFGAGQDEYPQRNADDCCADRYDLTTHLALIFLLNFVLGIGLILRWIACDTWIVAVAKKDERGRAIGVHETLMGLGIAVGPLLLVVFGVGSTAPYYACAVIV